MLLYSVTVTLRMSMKLKELVEKWRCLGFSEAVIELALLTPMVKELK
jgi:hypothetical protein